MLRLTAMVAVLALGAVASADEKKAEGAAASDPLHPRLKMETTLGDIVLELDGEKAPISTENFVRYASDGFYNGTIFHRVMSNFMIQAGGYTAELDEKKDGLRPPVKNEWRNGLKNDRGTIAMARTQAADSATAQFYINVVDNKALDMPRGGAAYAVFGKVVEGMDVVDKIKDTEVAEHAKLPMGKVVPVETVEIKSVTLMNDLTLDAVATAVKPMIEVRKKADEEAMLAAKKAQEEARMAAKKAQEEAKMAAMKEAEPRAKAFAALIANGKDENGAELKKTDSGLQYVQLKTVADGASPKPTDTVEIHYSGWLLNGTEFDSSAKHGKPLTRPLNSLVKGWIEGVGMMKVGEKWRFVIPPDLGYGERGYPPIIPPNSTLVFDIELISIK